MSKKIVSYPIEFCNHNCIYFFHNYDDNENCWCGLLDKRVFEGGDSLTFMDYTKRDIPEECPLPDEN